MEGGPAKPKPGSIDEWLHRANGENRGRETDTGTTEKKDDFATVTGGMVKDTKSVSTVDLNSS